MKNIKLAFAVIAAFAAVPSHAFWNDRIEIFADQVLTHDSNVFRLSSGADTQSALGTNQRADWLSVTSLGVTADIPYSLQRFQGGYTWFTTRYRRFDQLDFNGHNARAAWLWAITPHVTGEIGATDAKSLASFATFRTTDKDLVTSRTAYANANWEITPSFVLYGGITRNEREYDSATRQINNLKVDAEEVRFSYQTASENRLGIAYRHEEGDSPERLVFGVPFDNAYRQDGVGIVGRWQLTGLSRFDGRFDYVRRKYEQFRERDYNGPSARLTWTYVPTGKLTFATSIYREIAPLDEVQTSFVLATGASFRPRWDVSAKVAVLGNLEYARWDYRNSLPFVPGTTIPGAIPGDYRHNTRTAGVTVVWRPLTRVLFQAGLLREVRGSTLAFADYTANVFSIEGRIGF